MSSLRALVSALACQRHRLFSTAISLQLIDQKCQKTGKAGFDVLLSQRRRTPISVIDLADKARLTQNLEVMGEGSLCDRKSEGHTVAFCALGQCCENGNGGATQRIRQCRQDDAEVNFVACWLGKQIWHEDILPGHTMMCKRKVRLDVYLRRA